MTNPDSGLRDQLDDDRSESWQALTADLLEDLGYKIDRSGPLPGSMVADGSVPGVGLPQDIDRWLVLCRFGLRSPVISTDELISGLSEAGAEGVMGFDCPETSADQKAQFDKLPEKLASHPIAPLQFYRDHVRDPERRKMFLKLYRDLAEPSLNEALAAAINHPVTFFFWGLFFWALVAATVQHGLMAPVLIFLGLLVLAFLVGASGGLIGAAVRIWGPYVAGLFGIPIMLSWLVGPYNGWRDWVIALTVLALVVAFGSRLVSPLVEHVSRTDPEEQQQSRQTWRRRIKAVMWLMITWVAVSASDAWFGPGWWSPIAPLERPRQLDAGPLIGDRIGIALSGGGYRAALFHAGVLATLEENKIPISALATVSGGSIIGGYYTLGGNPQLFRDAVADGRFNLKRELLGIHNLLRLPCPGRIALSDHELELFWFCHFGRDDVQSALLDRNLYDGVTLNELADGKYPRWIIAGTDLVTGQAVGFTADGIIRLDQAVPLAGIVPGAVPRTPSSVIINKELGDIGSTRIARLVAASGAFPGAFQASVIRTSADSADILISDGGLTDNFGFSLLASAHKLGDSWDFGLILVSDGSETLQSQVSKGIGQLARAMEVVYASAGIDPVKDEPPPNVLRLSPHLLDPADDVMMGNISAFFSGRQDINSLTKIKARAEHCKEVFNKTSTLKDQIPRDDAYCIFELGEYAVAANRQAISDASN